MKKMVGLWWVKSIVALLCAASLLTGGISFAAMLYAAEFSQGELADEVNRRIADNYMAKALNDYENASGNADFLHKVEQDIDPQLRFAIVKHTGRSYASYFTTDAQAVADEIGAYGADAEYIYGTAEDVEKASYWMIGGETLYYYFADASLTKMMQSGYSVEDGSNDTLLLTQVEVYHVIYDAETGVFYYETDLGYYPVHSVVVTENGETRTYVLTEVQYTEAAAAEAENEEKSETAEEPQAEETQIAESQDALTETDADSGETVAEVESAEEQAAPTGADVDFGTNVAEVESAGEQAAPTGAAVDSVETDAAVESVAASETADAAEGETALDAAALLPSMATTLVYIASDGRGALASLSPGSEVQMENSSCATRILTENEELVNMDPGTFVWYVHGMDSLTDAANVHGYENTFVEDSMLVIGDGEKVEHDYYYIFSYVDETVDNTGFPGFFAEAGTWVARWEQFVPFAIPVEILSVVVFLATLLFLMNAAGHRGQAGEDGTIPVRLTKIDGIWLEIVTAAVFLAECGIGALMVVSVQSAYLTVAGLLTVETELAFAFCVILIWYFMTVAARVKAGKLLRNTAVYWLWRIFRVIWKKVWSVPVRFFRWMIRQRRAYKEFSRTHGSIVWRTVLLLTGITVLLVVTYAWFCYYLYWEELYVLWIFALIAVIWIFTMALVMQLTRLQEGGRRLAEGDFSNPIDTKGLFWEFKVHAENINRAGDGIANAVEKQMKSERFKTELITNVSHDIKTPLTSIINYVDLMQKEAPEDEKLREYIDVLVRQSARLKKLIEDLMEASKASTGNLAVHLETCDAHVLITQIVGEFAEKTAACQLEMIVDAPKEAVNIRVDSRHIWRVFDNLLSNVCKYAQPGTRVYISLAKDGGEAVITCKNISKYQLNITSEELMERFVRGDSSRNTEGSGLGLSIAQSLAALMNGTLTLSVDGDLFKVTLRFPITGGDGVQP